jgi:glutamine amidotransferase
MTRLFGCICNQPQALGRALEPVRAALVAEGPISRWGLGYVQWSEVCLKLHPRGSREGVDFYDALASLQSDYCIGSAVPDQDGLKGNANTQPFRFRQWIYAQEGNVPRFDEVQGRILEHIPGYLQRNIKGRTAAEYVFHLFLAMLHDAGNLDDHNLDLAATRRALRNTLAFVDSLLGDPADGPGNIICSNSRSMIAVRRGRPLFMRRLKEHTDPKLPESQFRAVLALSADSKPGEGFEEIPTGKVVAVRRDITTEIVDLENGPGNG